MICEELQPHGFQRGCTGGVIMKQALICGCRIDDEHGNSDYSDICWVEGNSEVDDFIGMSYKRGFSSGIVINNKVST